jgi:aspartate/methionine/tyrosine aminotransferase
MRATMTPPISSLVAGVEAPPIAAVQGWVRGRRFPADKPLIDLAQALPGHPPPDALVAHLAERLADPAVHRYTEILGLPALRAAHAAEISAAYGTPVPAEAVAVTAGCNQAFCLALMVLASAGDEVILPLPAYFNYAMWLAMLGVTAVPLRFRAQTGGLPDPEEADARIGGRTRAIVLISPNNPTGAVYPPAEIHAFYALAKRRGIALVLDETYKDFLLVDGRAHDLFGDPDWPQTLVRLYSFSKVFALTGHRVGSLVAGPAVLEAVEKIMDCIAICAPRPGQEAALYGLEHLGGWVAANTAAMRARGAAFRATLSALPGYRLISLGAYFAYVEHAEPTADAWTVARGLADDHNLLTLPGPVFGAGQERYLRLAFANVPAEMAPLVGERLAAAASR